MRWGAARLIAGALLAGEWTEDAMRARVAAALGRRPAWRRQLVREVLATWPEAPRHDRDGVARRVAAYPDVRVRRVILDAPAMAPTSFGVPPLATVGDVARHLALPVPRLDWFADRKGLERTVDAEPLRHYRYTWIPKPSGGARLVEQPKPRLRAIQRRLLHTILDRIPAHDAAHGFRRGRSIVSCAAPHAGRAVVMRIDLEAFFASVRGGRVTAIFHAAGYPDEVARTLAALCVNRVPAGVIARGRTTDPGFARTARHLAHPHLPQGAPTSPALANLAAYGLDVRLAALAASVGAAYTRYADDLFFSGDGAFARRADRFHAVVASIALDEGFAVNTRKTRVMRRGVRQRVTSIVVNAHPNVDRATYDHLKAILTNCVRHGATLQNHHGIADFRAHLAGKIAWVSMVAPARGAKLAALFDQVTSW